MHRPARRAGILEETIDTVLKILPFVGPFKIKFTSFLGRFLRLSVAYAYAPFRTEEKTQNNSRIVPNF